MDDRTKKEEQQFQEDMEATLGILERFAGRLTPEQIRQIDMFLQEFSNVVELSLGGPSGECP